LINVHGLLYGTTVNGGSASRNGAIYTITTAGVEKVIYAFGSFPDGAGPMATSATSAASGHTGKMVDNLPLKVLSYDAQFWIYGSRLVAADKDAADAYIYNYPSGGNRTYTITGLDDQLSVTISGAPSGTRTRH
jgi:uncharacterized repeat protein (TIGR03803 family)